MNIFTIFDTDIQGIYSVKYNNEDKPEFNRLFEFWQNVGALVDYFTSNREQLKGFSGGFSIKEAVERTIDDSIKLEEDLLSTYEINEKYLDEFFTPLHKIYSKESELEEQKAYGIFDKSWLRLYALRLGENYYLITGGGIKLTATMKEDELLRLELNKLKRSHLFCKEEGIIDIDGLQTFR